MMMNNGNGGAELARLERDVSRQVRLLDAVQRIAKASEDAAAVLAELGESRMGDKLLQQAAEHYRWAARVAEFAKGERMQQTELITRDDES